MIILVIGGSGSGKSELAENLAVKLGDRRLYTATMMPYSEEAHARIARHRKQRSGKGFDSIDCYYDIDKAVHDREYDTILLECMSNLAANEMFEKGAGADKVISETKILSQKCQNLIIVSNDVFCDGDSYSEETLKYIEMLGKINAGIAEYSDSVIECVASIPLIHKGAEYVKEFI